MAIAGEGPDALRFEVAAAESRSLAAVGTLRGIALLAAGGANGPGTAHLKATGDGSTIAWRAPGSATYGSPVNCADQSALLFDGTDPRCFVRVRGYAAYMPAAGPETRIFMADRYNNAAGHDDVSAAEALAGDISTWTVTLRNASGAKLETIRVWLDASVTGIQISATGVVWSAPTDEATGIVIPDIAPNGTGNLYVKRTIGAGASSNPAVLVIFHAAWNGPG